jgi:archaellin
MTRAVVFLAIAMAAASLGVVAQDTSGTTQNSAQNSTDRGAGTVAAKSQQTAAVSNQHDSTKASSASDPQMASSAVNTDTDNGQLPQTSTILPLLGLIGLGSLVAGFFARH